MSEKTYRFDPALLGNHQADSVDIALFSEDGAQLPGPYRVDIFLNRKRVDSREIVFVAKKGKKELSPCFSREILLRYGVLVDDYPEMLTKEDETSQCIDLSAITGVTTQFDFARQQLKLSIPQVALRKSTSGQVPKELWDEGITAFRMNYLLNGRRMMPRDRPQSTNHYANLQSVLNLGGWRVHNFSTWQQSSNQSGAWKIGQTNAKKGLYHLDSQLALGEFYTSPNLFDSVPILGGQIISDDNMRPYSERGYAPVIRGIARTNARVQVEQNGTIIYTGTVSPGAFALNDLTAVSSGGVLNVTVYEEDGSVQNIVVPFASLPIFLRQSAFQYAITAGRYWPMPTNDDETPGFGQVTAIYGLPWNITAYGGVQSSRDYLATTFGVGSLLWHLGALSVDMTESQVNWQDGENERGKYWRLRYSNSLAATGTTFSLSRLQYDSMGFWSLAEVVSVGDSDSVKVNERQRDQFSIQASQQLARWGSVSLTWLREGYWQQELNRESFGLYYGSSWQDISWGVSGTLNRYPNDSIKDKTERLVSLNISISLSRWLSNASLSYSLNHSSFGPANHYMSLSGLALDRQLNWGVQQNITENRQQSNNSSANLRYRGGYGEVNGRYGYSSDNRSLDYGVAGSVLAHGAGVTLAQRLGTTVALVEAPGAAGVAAQSRAGVRTDFRGYTVFPSLQPYSENRIALDPTTVSDDAALESFDMRVVPTEGAVVRAKFATRSGARALLTLKRPNGKAIPLGAIASLDSDKAEGNAGMVGAEGQVYLTGIPEQGSLRVQWGKGDHQRCLVDYELSMEKNLAGMYEIQGICK
ncbi:fimbrial biogenesis outer membrane usher protein [Serratia sp. JSRIV001]|uniref:fimbria/pilus outer membrane usher protein n=1 Tax=unclassified Serratia (in: enterobacteria) TaxID=2647522 RepID=UPI001CBEEA7B|nr:MULTISPECIES: fimbria/pilus outer membrane usher protein [unclassified Serratia (in: enterobacteria)]UAN45152.1 fimbrial biogenesis outer membrane usher protein [Serratia sp. JSRIV001]UAN50659.1 fimbrial biogenesis outer membrane usher protein [Serratia sp. JSRIV002]UAN56616.1 fimbrial biogenesis outer membrane usher protein [Serratia sp. JSRIV004]